MSAPIALATPPAAPTVPATPAPPSTTAAAPTTDGDAFAGLLSTLAGAPAPTAGGRAGAHPPKTPGPKGTADGTPTPGSDADAAADGATGAPTDAALAVAATLALPTALAATPAGAPSPAAARPAEPTTRAAVINSANGSPQRPVSAVDHGVDLPAAALAPGERATPQQAAARPSPAPAALAPAAPALPAPAAPVIKRPKGAPVHLPSPLDHDTSSVPSSAQLPTGPAPVVAAAGSAAPVAVAPTTPAPSSSGPIDPQPALTATLARLRSHGDGSHELSVQLHPAELGAVNVSATIRDGQLTVTVACADSASRAAVTAALPALHHQLSSAGFGGVDVHFGGPSHGHDQPGAAPDQRPVHDRPDTGPDHDDRSAAPAPTTAARRHASQQVLDRLL